VQTSSLSDPETLHCFLVASNYCFGYSDSDEGDYGPSTECFHLETRGVLPEGHEATGVAEPGNEPPPHGALFAE